MNATKKIVIAIGISSLAALPLMAGPSVLVQVSAPAVTVAAVPGAYAWDGYEYVGVVGTQYYYLDAGNAWLPLDTGRLGHFHDWERIHADWRAQAIRNDLHRYDAHGHYVPRHDDKSHDHGY